MITIIKTAYRSIISYKRNSILNIIGLTLGLTITVLMVMLLNYELSFDKFHANSNNILCILGHDLKDGSLSASTPYPMPATLKQDFPEVKYVTGFNPVLGPETELSYENVSYSGFRGASVGEDVFSIFDYKLVVGKASDVLSAPDKIVLSEQTAKKIFNQSNPIGETLKLDGFSFTIAGVFTDLPKNSSLNFDILFSAQINAIIWEDSPRAWWASGLSTYVILNEGFTAKDFNTHLQEIPDKYYPDFLKGRSTYTSLPFGQLHFDKTIRGGLTEPVSVQYLILLGAIALLTLLISCFNFISLTIGLVRKRNIEAGIRRISGASASQIIKHYIAYSSGIIFVAGLLAVCLSWLILPVFETLVNRSVTSQFFNPTSWLVICCICIMLIVITGIVPGALFSRIKPAQVLKKNWLHASNNKTLQRSFVLFQFTIATVLIICQLVIFRQIRSMKNADVGFNMNNLTSIDLRNTDINRYDLYNKVKLYSETIERGAPEFGISKGSVTENIPGYYFENSFTVLPSQSKLEEILVVSTSVDENFLGLFEIDLLHGRFFSPEFASDRDAFIINETAMNKLGWSDIEGKTLKLSQDSERQPVIGVISDITQTSLKEAARPMIFRFRQHNNFPAFLSYRINAKSKAAALAYLENTWHEIFLDTPFSYLDVKETYYRNYESEQELAKTVGIFSCLSIFLSLLGLFGMISLTTELKIKEIGIRKVNGAKVGEILALVNWDIARWVLLSFLLAIPIAALAANKWLQNFAYKITISWWLFAVGFLIVIILLLITISLQSWRAATRNPVEALRYE